MTENAFISIECAKNEICYRLDIKNKTEKACRPIGFKKK